MGATWAGPEPQEVHFGLSHIGWVSKNLVELVIQLMLPLSSDYKVQQPFPSNKHGYRTGQILKNYICSYIFIVLIVHKNIVITEAFPYLLGYVL